MKKFFFTYSINMCNPSQNEIEQFQRDINLLHDELKQLKKTEFIAKQTKLNR